LYVVISVSAFVFIVLSDTNFQNATHFLVFLVDAEVAIPPESDFGSCKTQNESSSLVLSYPPFHSANGLSIGDMTSLSAMLNNFVTSSFVSFSIINAAQDFITDVVCG
jgi:hypothetical protein